MASLFGEIKNPLTTMGTGYGGIASDKGLVYFISNLVKLVTVAAGLFAFINLIIAGFTYISAGDDSKKVDAAWTKIYMSFIGLAIIIGSYAIAAVIGILMFGNPSAILSPTIYGPGTGGK